MIQTKPKKALNQINQLKPPNKVDNIDRDSWLNQQRKKFARKC